MSRIIVHTEQNPEDNAMLQALYSRSDASVTEHISKLKGAGSGEFMSKYYLGYGHKSIADCGFVTVYFENISMLAAKALEDHDLFNGQESSTRYIDFSKREFINPIKYFSHGLKNHNKLLRDGDSVLESLRLFYLTSNEELVADLKTRFHRESNQSEAVYEKAIQARAFDILRGWLPAGATTNVAVTMNLRNLEEHLSRLIFHPLTEVSQMAWKGYEQLRERFPNSFRDIFNVLGQSFEASAWDEDLKNHFDWEYLSFHGGEVNSFYNPVELPGSVGSEDIQVKYHMMSRDVDGFASIEPGPGRNPFPRHLFKAWNRITVEALIDFGSYRDIQRHRAGYCSNFMLSNMFVCSMDGEIPDHPWYKDQLTDSLREKAEALDSYLQKTLRYLYDAPTFLLASDLQYFFPMKSVVPLALDYDIEQARYVAELRAGKTVHPTLRPIAQAIGRELNRQQIRCNFDNSEDSWTIKRGTQDIIEVTS